MSSHRRLRRKEVVCHPADSTSLWAKLILHVYIKHLRQILDNKLGMLRKDWMLR